MMRLFSVLALMLALFAPSAGAQDPEMARFLGDMTKAVQYEDAGAIDKAVKAHPRQAILHFQNLKVEAWSGRTEVQKTLDALKASFPRCFEKSELLDRIERWVDAQSKDTYESYVKLRTALDKCYGLRDEAFKNNTNRKVTDEVLASVVQVANALDQIGHRLDAAEAWALAAQILAKAPERTTEDRRMALYYIDRFMEARKAWYWTADDSYVQNEQFAKVEKLRVEEAAKEDQKRAAAGYDPNARGIDALLMANAEEDVHDLEFEMLKNWDELDYCPKGGPVPGFWWQGNFDDKANAQQAPLLWFRKTSLFLLREGASRYAISPLPSDPKRVYEIDAGSKARPSMFWFDEARTLPYAMFFWIGSDKERIGEADVNLAPAPQNTAVFYRSAASWTTQVGSERITFYDDSGNGNPMDENPRKDELKLYTLGDPEQGQIVPLLDSMRIGKGPRVPFSQFVQLDGAWKHLRVPADGKIGLRPFNPEYLKTGKVKLSWKGPRPTAPDQLVIEGSGDYLTARFDIASGKEIEVPAAEYRVIYGRILDGKGARARTATIWPGTSKPFVVLPGKTTVVQMGAPFGLSFVRGGSGQDVEIEGARIVLTESSGCVIAEPQNMVPVPDVLAAREESGKGAKVIAKFVKLDDPELLNKAAARYSQLRLFVAFFPVPEGNRDGSLLMKCRLPAPGMKVGLSIKKHPLFGKVTSAFQ
ncbi:MAG: hypothetical protein Fur0037_25740 [Planctomycetota bacterium]